MALRSNNLHLAWTGDYDSLKQFFVEELQLPGTWDQPGNDKKVLKVNDTTISWRPSKSVLHIEGKELKAITQLLCTKIGGNMDAIESGVMKTVSSLLVKTVTSQSRFCECKEMHSEIKALKFGQDINRMAIQSLSEVIARITDVLSQNQEDNDNKRENINNDTKGIFNNLQEPNHEILQHNTFHASEMSNVNIPKWMRLIFKTISALIIHP